MHITMIGRVMFVLVFFVFVVFVLQVRSTPPPNDTTNDLEDVVNSCSQPDLSNCQYFYNCLGILNSCRAQDRFDSTTNQCQNYYLTNCGDRYNPPFPSVSELCTPFWNNQFSQSIFPTLMCSQYVTCDSTVNVTHTQHCPSGTMFSLVNMKCMPVFEVDCGMRHS